MVETGKDYALSNKFSSAKIEEALFFGRQHHIGKFWIEDWVVEKALEMSKQEGRVEGAIEKLNLVLDKSYFISRIEVSIKQVPTLRVYIKDLIKQLKQKGMN